MHSLLTSLKRRQPLLVCLRPEVVVPQSKEKRHRRGVFLLLYKGYEKDIFREPSLGFELKRFNA